MADLTPDLQVRLLWGLIAESFHSLQSLSVSCFHVILGLPGPCFPSTCMSKAVLTAPAFVCLLLWTTEDNKPRIIINYTILTGLTTVIYNNPGLKAKVLPLLNKLRCHAHFQLSANLITWSRVLTQIHILNDKQDRSRKVGFFKPIDLDLHCLQRWSISWLSRTRVNPCPAEPGYTLPLQTV